MHWEVEGLIDGWGRQPGREVMVRPGFDGEPWAAHTELLDGDGWIPLPLGLFLLRGAGRVMLVDLGLGPVENRRNRGGALPDLLRARGISPDQVTDVLFTHLHGDHVGWASREGQVQFRNARHRVHRADWEHFVAGPGAAPDGVATLRPIENLVEFAEDGEEVAPGVRLHLAPGHTPGHSVFEVEGDGTRTWLLGDLAHAPFELEEPGWQVTFDDAGEHAERTRAAFVERLAASGDLLFAAHFPDLRPGRLERTERGPRWAPAVEVRSLPASDLGRETRPLSDELRRI